MFASYKGQPVFLYDETGETIAHSVIAEHDCNRAIITIPSCSCTKIFGKMLVVLIITEQYLYEYRGRTRSRASDSMLEILLFKGREKWDGRQAKRFQVNRGVSVAFIIVEYQRMPLLHPLAVDLINISTSGALVRSKPNTFNVDDIVEIDINIGKNPLVLNCQVIRIDDINGSQSDYGCKFVEGKEKE